MSKRLCSASSNRTNPVVVDEANNHSGGKAVIITAAGRSARMGGIKKELARLDGVPVLKKAVTVFAQTGIFDSIAITFLPGFELELRAMFEHSSIGAHELLWVPGGETRQESVFNALCSLEKLAPEYVLIHDAARPWVTQELIVRVLKGTEERGACIPVVPHVDAPKRISGSGKILEHLDRSSIVGAQTPQGFRYTEILKAHRRARFEGNEYPDDAQAYHHTIGEVSTVAGDPANRKITFSHDI